MNYVIYPEVAPDRSLLGGKAYTLALLGSFPVPEWFAISPAAFQMSLTVSQQQSFAAGDRTFLAQMQLHPTVQAELTAALATLCASGESVAVRSSALEEDGQHYSFAGQLDSFLNVSPTEVAGKIVAVWQSGFSDRLLTYRAGASEVVMQPPAVLIQKMVQADYAGVAFSANPVTGQRGTVVISATAGLGEALVSGACEGETYLVDRTGNIMQDPSSPMAETALLTEEMVQAIASLVRRVEQQLGRPQDIEWAIARGQLYLLQARPITTLAKLADPDGVLNLWDNSNIAESYGGITTPLTFSFARCAYEAVYRQFCRLMGVPEATIAQHDATFRCMLGLVQGRIYYNLLNWYRVLALLPGFTVNRGFMEQMMGVREELPPDVLATLARASWGDKLKDSLRFGTTLMGLVKNYLTLPQQIDRFYQRLNHALTEDINLATARPDELVAVYHQLEQKLLTRWDAPLVNDFFAMIFYGILRKLTAQWCDQGAGTLQNDLISGEGGMISAEPAQRVQNMAATLAPYPQIAALLRTGTLPQILSAIAQVPSLYEQYQAYLAKFGDRCLEELKLESITLHEEPLLLLRSIGHLAQQGHSERVSAPRQAAEQQVQQALRGHPCRRWIFGWVLKTTRARVRDRENLRFERTRVFGRVRRLFAELGKRFYALDQITDPRDIFYLEVNEILGFVNGTATCTDLRGLVQIRKAEFDRYQQLPPGSDRFFTQGTVHPLQVAQPSNPTAQSPDPHALQGTGCCPGIVRGQVQIVTDPKTAVLQPGCILVAERTDPGWILLFPAAAGLLVERGSLLSHSAIVAREMGIPAIVSIPGITRWLKDGDWVEMDGNTGAVQRISCLELHPVELQSIPQQQAVS